MASFGEPVAQNVNVSANQGIATISGLLGIKQQQQQLGTGAYVQQQEQAKAQSEQQQMAEHQLLQQTMKTGVDEQGNSIYKDGSDEIDPSKFARFAGRALPLTGQAVTQSIIDTQQKHIDVQKAALGLNSELRDKIGTTIMGAQGTGLPADQIMAHVQDAVGNSPQAQGAIQSAGVLMSGLDKIPPGQQRDRALTHLAENFLTADHLQTLQASRPAAVQAPGGLQFTETNQFAPGGAGAPLNAQPLRQTIAPTVITPPGGIPAIAGSGTGRTGAGVGSSYPGPPPNDQDMTRFGVYENNLNNRVQIASDSLPRIKLVEDALAANRTGGGAEARTHFAQQLQAVNAPKWIVDAVAGGNLGDMQEAEKFLFQTTLTGLRQSMQGDPARVAEFNAAENVFPTISTDPRARAKVMQMFADQGQRDFSEQQALRNSREQNTFNPATWEATYQAQLRKGGVPGTPASQVPKPLGQSAPTFKSKSGRPYKKVGDHFEYTD